MSNNSRSRSKEEKESWCFLSNRTLGNIKGFEDGNYCIISILSWTHFGFMLFWKRFFWVGREEVISESLIISLCHLLTPPCWWSSEPEISRETKAMEVSSAGYSKHETTLGSEYSDYAGAQWTPEPILRHWHSVVS